jgi:AraC-like DNA-binding protein
VLPSLTVSTPLSAATVSEDVLAFVARCQDVVGAWIEGKTLEGLSSLWSCLNRVPVARTFEERATIASAVLRIAVGARNGIDSYFPAGFEPGARRRRASPDVRVAQLLDSLHHRYQEPHVSLESLARSLGLSVAYMSRTIYRQTGMHFSTHLNGVRLLAGVVLLESTTLRIKEVAAAVGYRGTGELDRQCRRWLHMTPNEIRQCIRGVVGGSGDARAEGVSGERPAASPRARSSSTRALCSG